MIITKKDMRTQKSYIKIFSCFLCFFVLITIICFMYYQRLYRTIREENRSYLHEISNRISNNVSRIITDNFAILHTMSDITHSMQSSPFSELADILVSHQENLAYELVVLIDENGRSYDMSGNEVHLSLDDSSLQQILSGEDAISATQLISNKECIFFSTPVDKAVIDDKAIVAIAATYDPASFDKALSMTSFDEQAYSQLVFKNGSAITQPAILRATKPGYNVFSSLENADMNSGSSLSEMKTSFSSNRSGLISFDLGGSSRYMVYTPVGADDWYLLTIVPIDAVNAKSDMLLRSTLIICGIIVILFSGLAGALIYVSSKNKRHLEHLAYVDKVTDGNTIQKFYLSAYELLTTPSIDKLVIVYTNISKFKVLNEQLGRQSCDLILRSFYEYLASHLNENETMCRLTADNFCMLLEFTDEKALISRFTRWRIDADEKLAPSFPWGLPVVEFGIYTVLNRNMPIPQMIDRAKLSLKESMWAIDSKLSYAFYDDGIRLKIFREKYLEDRMEAALSSCEFQVYYQPKFNLKKNCIGGAEALVRWISSEDGMIYPDEFIPLFEKNGFVIQLDLWVFEEVCANMESWATRSLEPIRVSVNCSRIHFKHPNFIEPYIRIANKYSIDRKFIEIEITESTVFENSHQLIRIINQIRDAGFSCSMDDFGSGYSSLNLLQSIPVDTLKVDKSFFIKSNSSVDRVEAIVKSIVGMASSLSMETVAEGVEYPDQVEMLRRIGCDYIQGYVYAKPMCLSDFETFSFETKPVL